MSTTATRKPTKSAANRSALREAVAALNEGRHEDYLALFDPEARLHHAPHQSCAAGFPATPRWQ